MQATKVVSRWSFSVAGCSLSVNARVILAFVLFLLPAQMRAQTFTTSLRGTVTDSTGAVVPGATVTLEDKSTGTHLTTQTDEKGAYQFLQLPPALYTVTASGRGFADQVKEAELLVNQPATISFAMSVHAAQEIVNVSAEAETLNTTDAAIGNSVPNNTIEALPMEGRNVPDLLSLQPGVLYLDRKSVV